MAEKVQQHDFIEIDYTGSLADGTIFDTTQENIAKHANMYSPKLKYQAAIICIGEKQLLSGLDEALPEKEIGQEYKILLPAEKAFGKRDIKKIRIIPANLFKEHKMVPQPGLQIDVDGQLGTVTNVSGGRVIVNFNHPLAGKEVQYTFTIHKKVTDPAVQIATYIVSVLQLPFDVPVSIQEEKAEITLPLTLPAPVMDALTKKIVELTKIKDVLFKSKEVKKE